MAEWVAELAGTQQSQLVAAKQETLETELRAAEQETGVVVVIKEGLEH